MNLQPCPSREGYYCGPVGRRGAREGGQRDTLGAANSVSCLDMCILNLENSSSCVLLVCAFFSTWVTFPKWSPCFIFNKGNNA